MLKKSVTSLTFVAALLSMHSAAFATCQGDDCQIELDTNINFDSDFHLDNDHNGIYLQSNHGTNTAVVNLLNVVMRDNGDISASAQAVGNNMSVSLNSSSMVPVRHVSQSNYGDQHATVRLVQRATSKAGEISIEAVSIGNNLSMTLDNASLAELSVAQCNVSDNVALVEYRWDPTGLKASATAVGNNISIAAARP